MRMKARIEFLRRRFGDDFARDAAAVATSSDGIFLEIDAEKFAALRRTARPKSLGLGDLVEKAAKPIAKALRLDCLDERGELKPESKCAKRKRWLNRLTNRDGIK